MILEAEEMKTEIILLGHGSRRREANDGLIQMARKVSSLLKQEVSPAFMAHGTPSFPEAVQQKINEGAGRIVIMPLFLFRGIHVTVDIQSELEQIIANHPGVEVVFTKELGPDDGIAQLASTRIRRAIEA